MTRASYAEEASSRWGHTEAFRQSQRRAASYTQSDWDEIGRQTDRLEARIVAAMRAGWPADSTIVMGLAEEHRELLSRWFYECSTDLHRSLGAMYVEDDRFAQHYEMRAPGLSSYLCAAIHANADRTEGHGV